MRIRRALRRSAYLLAGLLSLGLASLLLLQSPPARHRALNALRTALRVQGFELEASSLDYRLLALHMRLEGVRLRAIAAPDLPPLLSADGIDVDLGWKALVRRRVRIEAASLGGARLHLVRDARGRTNLPPAGVDPRAASGPRGFQLRRLVALVAAVQVDDALTRSELWLPRVDVRIAGEDVRFGLAEPGRLTRDGRSLAIEQAELVARVDLAAGMAEVRSLTFSTEAGSGTARGRTGLSGRAPPLELDVVSDLHLAPLLAMAGIPGGAAGDVHVEVSARGPLDRLEGTLTVAGQQLSICALQGFGLAARARFEPSDSTVLLEQADVSFAGGHVTATGVVALSGAAPATRLDAQISRLALAPLGQALGLPITIASRAWGSAEVRLAGLSAASLLHADASAALTLSPTQGDAAPSVLPLGGSLRLEVEAGRTSLRLEDVAALGSSLRGRLELDSTGWGAVPGAAIGGGIEGEAASASELERQVRRFLGREARAAAMAEGPLRLTAGFAGTLGRPQADVTLDSAAISLAGLPAAALEARLLLDGDGHAAATATLQKDDAVLDVSAEIAIAARSLVARVHASSLPLPTLLAFAGHGGLPAGGSLDLEGHVSGPWSAPLGSIVLSSPALTWAGRPLGPMDATLAVDPQGAHVSARLGELALDAEGRLGAAAPYDVELVVRAAGTELSRLPFGLAARPGGKLTGQVRLALPLQRAADLQAVTLDARLEPFELVSGGRSVATDAPLALRLVRGRLTVDPVGILTGGARLHLAGSVALAPGAPAGELRVAGEADLSFLLPLGLPGSEASGHLVGDLALRGEAGALAIDGTLQLRDAGLSHPGLRDPLREVSADVRIDGSAVHLDRFEARLGTEGRLDADAILPLRLLGLRRARPAAGGDLARLRLDAQGLSPGDVRAVPWWVHGAIALHVEVQAPRLAAAAVTGSIRADDIRLRSPAFELRAEAPAEITIAGGSARLAPLVLTGPDTRIEADGSLALPVPGRDGALSLRAAGEADLGVVSIFSRDVTGSGRARFSLAAAGSPGAPSLTGHVEIRDGQLAAASPALAAEGLDARLDLAGGRISIEHLLGTLNGGTVEASGWIDLGAPAGPRADARLTTRNVYLDVPAGLHSVADADLTLGNREDGLLLLAGRVRIAQGSYTETLKLEEWLRDHVRSGQQVDLTGEQERPKLPPVALDVRVHSLQPIEVDNNLARVAAQVRLQLVGTLEHPGLLGRAELEEGGEIYLNQRRFVVERAIATFTSESRILPALDVIAEASVGGYDVSLAIAGETGRFTTRLSSSPELAEPDILALLLTGRTLAQVQGAEGDVAKEQVLSYVSGRLGGFLDRRKEGGRGLSRVRIEPTVIAGETDPRARLTLSQELSRRLTLAFSTDLTGGGDIAYILDYDVGRSLDARAIRQDDGSIRGELAQRLRFGGSEATRSRRRGPAAATEDVAGNGPPAARDPSRVRDRDRRIGRLAVSGNARFDRKQVLDRFDLEPGDRADFLRLRKGIRRIEELYAKADHLEARVRMTPSRRDRELDVDLAVVEGPRVDLALVGGPAGDLRSRAAAIWRAGAIDAQRADALRRHLREELVTAGHLAARVEVSVARPEPGRKRVQVVMTPGARDHELDLLVAGASPGTTRKLEERLEDRAARAALLARPWQRARELRNVLRGEGLLDARVERPRLEKDEATGRSRVRLQVHEGPAYHLSALRVEGQQGVPREEIEGALPVHVGDLYTKALLDRALRAVQELYWGRGYDRATVSSLLRRGASTGTVELTLRIAEGLPRVVADVRVEGNDRTSARMVRGQLDIEAGGLLKDEQLTRSRKNLYDTGAFSLVELRTEPMGPAEELADAAPRSSEDRGAPRAEAKATLPGAAETEAFAATSPAGRPVRVIARVREQRPFEVRYGAFFDSQRGLGLSLDLLNRNSLGSARTIGLHARRDAQLREARVFLGQPLLRRFPVKTTLTGYRSRELLDEEEVDRTGVSIAQEHRIGRRLVVSWGYRLEELTGVVVADAIAEGPRAERRTVRIAPLGVTFTRDTRDDVLDATSGTLLTQSLEAGPGFLGSRVRIARYFGQHARYLRFGGTREDPFDRTRTLPRFVWASSARLGLGSGLEDVPLAASTRFLAGGASTVRGFAQDAIGRRLPDGRAAGGNALLVLNTELRFPLWWILDGVAFVDAGNVYDGIRDLGVSSLRVAAGLGLRLRTPFVVLRIDHGRKLDRRPGESPGATYFSIGQAF